MAIAEKSVNHSQKDVLHPVCKDTEAGDGYVSLEREDIQDFSTKQNQMENVSTGEFLAEQSKEIALSSQWYVKRQLIHSKLQHSLHT